MSSCAHSWSVDNAVSSDTRMNTNINVPFSPEEHATITALARKENRSRVAQVRKLTQDALAASGITIKPAKRGKTIRKGERA